MVSRSPNRSIFFRNHEGTEEDEGEGGKLDAPCITERTQQYLCVTGTCKGNQCLSQDRHRRLLCWKMRAFVQCFWRASACVFQQETKHGIGGLGMMLSGFFSNQNNSVILSAPLKPSAAVEARTVHIEHAPQSPLWWFGGIVIS